jgi:hypothetical protein
MSLANSGPDAGERISFCGQLHQASLLGTLKVERTRRTLDS